MKRYTFIKIQEVPLTKSYRRTYPKAKERVVVTWQEKIAPSVAQACSREFWSYPEADQFAESLRFPKHSDYRTA